MLCDMCGKESDLFLAEIEGTQLQVCRACAAFGKVVRRLQEYTRKQLPPQAKADEKEERIIPGFSLLVKQKREALGLSQEDFAKKLNEKVSLIHHIETGKVEPSLPLAGKIERFLHITLIEAQEDAAVKTSSEKSTVLTIGDLINVKGKQ